VKRSLFIPLVLALVVSASFASVPRATAAEASLNVTWRTLDNYLRPGNETVLFLSIENPSAYRIYDVGFRFDVGANLSVSPVNFSFNSIAPVSVQSTSVKITASDNAASGTSYVQVTAAYHVDSRSADEKLLTIWVPVVLRAVPLLQISGIQFDSSTIQPGSKVTVSFDVKNYGDGLAKDAVVSLDQAVGFFTSDVSDKYIGDVAVNASSKVSFSLIINQNSSAGSYSIPVSLTYADKARREIYSKREFVGLNVYGNLGLILTLDSQDLVAAGMNGTMEIKVANGGTLEAQFLQLRVLSSPALAEVMPDYIYVGKLKSDDYDTEKITFKVNDTAAKGVYPVSFQLTYQDSFGKQFSETKTVQLSVLSKEKVGSQYQPPFWLLAVFGVVIVLIIYYVLRKRRK